MTESVYEFNYFGSDFEKNLSINNNGSPLTTFLYALKSSEAKRQYPARLKKFFDFIGIRALKSHDN